MRTSLFILTITALLLNSCKKQDSDPQPDTIIRTWQPQSMALTALANNQSLTLYLRKSNTTNLIDYSTYRMTLGSAGALTITNNGQTDTGTWQVTKDQLTQNYGCCEKEVFTVETATATNLDLYYTISPTTQKASEQSILAGGKSYGLDTSKGVKLILRFTPL